jgi:hypothetical protein
MTNFDFLASPSQRLRSRAIEFARLAAVRKIARDAAVAVAVIAATIVVEIARVHAASDIEAAARLRFAAAEVAMPRLRASAETERRFSALACAVSAVRETGALRARVYIEIVRQLPEDATLESLTEDGAGLAIAGRIRDAAELGGTIVALDRAIVGGTWTLANANVVAGAVSFELRMTAKP